MTLTHNSNHLHWQGLLDGLSLERVHGSWRRAVLLSLVRAENADTLLTRVSEPLLAAEATLLQELIRLTMAVDGASISHAMQALGMDHPPMTGGLTVPAGLSWRRLTRWLLDLGENLPRTAVPQVVDLYTSWVIGMSGRGSLAPRIAKQFYRWLVDIEQKRYSLIPLIDSWRHDLRSLESKLRMIFLFLCDRTPDLARAYVSSLRGSRQREDIVSQIIDSPGSLARAAPEELADFVMSALLPQEDDPRWATPRALQGPFTFVSYRFVPASPAQRPFLDLLMSAPQTGLSLIRQLVDYACSFHHDHYGIGHESIPIAFPNETREFSALYSYGWPRPGHADPCVTSALMALEAWGHRRIEHGEDFDTVLHDIVATDAPAAYLLVAVDLILSHWSKSQESAIPFIASPELLCIDRERYIHDNITVPDVLGLKSLADEPIGVVRLDDLEKRVSRRSELYSLLPYYVFAPNPWRTRLVNLLREACTRLGAPGSQSDRSDPRFMGIHALNIIDPANWRQQSIEEDDGTSTIARRYTPPESELRHLAPLQDRVNVEDADADVQREIRLALQDPNRSSKAFAATVVAWARATLADTQFSALDIDRKQHIVAAATIAMRDGDSAMRAEYRNWACKVFDQTYHQESTRVFPYQSRLYLNPVAIAFAGCVHVLQDNTFAQHIDRLLRLVARHPANVIHGSRLALPALAEIDDHILRAMFRCAFHGCIERRKDPRLTDQAVELSIDSHHQRLESSVQTEIVWIETAESEPTWPQLPPKPVSARGSTSLRREMRQGVPATLERFDHQTGALWLRHLHMVDDTRTLPWLRQVVHSYAPWTAAANGSGLDARARITNLPSEWNEAYFRLSAHCLPNRDVDATATASPLELIVTLPDVSFLEVVTTFLRGVDDAYFRDRGLDDHLAAGIRSQLADRLVETLEWNLLRAKGSTGAGADIGSAVAVFFFGEATLSAPPSCYVLPKGIDRLEPLLSTLERLVTTCPSPFVAVLLLNLLEVSPRRTHLGILCKASSSWIERFPDSTSFWVDQGIGHRFCALVDNIWRQEADDSDTDEVLSYLVGQLLPQLVSMGVPDAAHLERKFAGL